MSNIHVSRAQTAYHRPVHRSLTSASLSKASQRPTTSKMPSEFPSNNILKVPAWRTASSSIVSGQIGSWRRPNTTSSSSVTSSLSRVDNSQLTEIERLVRRLDQKEKTIVQVDCLANYRKLSQAVDLRPRSFDQKSLCALQQLENTIVQKNACRDVRFRTLLESLSPQHKMGIVDSDSGINQINNSTIESQPYDHPLEY